MSLEVVVPSILFIILLLNVCLYLLKKHRHNDNSAQTEQEALHDQRSTESLEILETLGIDSKASDFRTDILPLKHIINVVTQEGKGKPGKSKKPHAKRTRGT